jgi:hypothetical protein
MTSIAFCVTFSPCGSTASGVNGDELEFANDPNLDHVGFLSSEDNDTDVDLAGAEEEKKESEEHRSSSDLRRWKDAKRNDHGHTVPPFLPPRQIRQTTTRPWRNDPWWVARFVGNGRCDHRHHPFGAISKYSSCPLTCTTMVEVNNRHNDDRAVVNPAKLSRPGRGR